MVSLPNQLSCQTEVVVIYNETVESVDWTRVVLAVKSLPASVGDAREVSSIPGSGRSPEDGNGNPLQYSCLENFMDRGAWWAIVHGVEKSWAWQWLNTHTQNGVCDRGPEAEWLLNCVASGQKGWIPRWENQNAILDALIQNLASTLLPLKKKKKSFTWPQIFGSITNCTKGDTAQVLNQSAPLLLHLWCGGKSDLISLTVVRIPWDEACKILFRVQLLRVC